MSLQKSEGLEGTHIENIDTDDWNLIFMPHMREEHEQRYEFFANEVKATQIGNSHSLIIDLAAARGLGTRKITSILPDANVVGVEIGLKYVRKAKSKSPEILYTQSDVLAVPVASDSADAVSMFEILEHLPKDKQPQLLSEAFRVLKPGGLAMVSTPLPYSYDSEGMPLGNSSNPNHIYEPNIDEVVGLIDMSGFKLVGQYGQSFATAKGIETAQKLEKSLSFVPLLPPWTLYALNLNGIRNPEPTQITNQIDSGKVPLTNVFVLRKPL